MHDLSRPFEFRAFHKPTGTLHAVASFTEELVYLPWNEALTDSENYRIVDKPFLRSDCVLMQCTGVCDRAGVKVFEGDILHYRYLPPDEPMYEQWYVVVYRFGSFFMLRDPDEDVEQGLLLSEYASVKAGGPLPGDVVVGCYYLNPELLDRSKEAVAV